LPDTGKSVVENDLACCDVGIAGFWGFQGRKTFGVTEMNF